MVVQANTVLGVVLLDTSISMRTRSRDGIMLIDLAKSLLGNILWNNKNGLAEVRFDKIALFTGAAEHPVCIDETDDLHVLRQMLDSVQANDSVDAQTLLKRGMTWLCLHRLQRGAEDYGRGYSMARATVYGHTLLVTDASMPLEVPRMDGIGGQLSTAAHWCQCQLSFIMLRALGERSLPQMSEAEKSIQSLAHEIGTGLTLFLDDNSKASDVLANDMPSIYRRHLEPAHSVRLLPGSLDDDGALAVDASLTPDRTKLCAAPGGPGWPLPDGLDLASVAKDRLPARDPLPLLAFAWARTSRPKSDYTSFVESKAYFMDRYFVHSEQFRSRLTSFGTEVPVWTVFAQDDNATWQHTGWLVYHNRPNEKQKQPWVELCLTCFNPLKIGAWSDLLSGSTAVDADALQQHEAALRDFVAQLPNVQRRVLRSMLAKRGIGAATLSGEDKDVPLPAVVQASLDQVQAQAAQTCRKIAADTRQFEARQMPQPEEPPMTTTFHIGAQDPVTLVTPSLATIRHMQPTEVVQAAAQAAHQLLGVVCASQGRVPRAKGAYNRLCASRCASAHSVAIIDMMGRDEDKRALKRESPSIDTREQDQKYWDLLQLRKRHGAHATSPQQPSTSALPAAPSSDGDVDDNGDVWPLSFTSYNSMRSRGQQMIASAAARAPFDPMEPAPPQPEAVRSTVKSGTWSPKLVPPLTASSTARAPQGSTTHEALTLAVDRPTAVSREVDTLNVSPRVAATCEQGNNASNALSILPCESAAAPQEADVSAPASTSIEAAADDRSKSTPVHRSPDFMKSPGSLKLLRPQTAPSARPSRSGPQHNLMQAFGASVTEPEPPQGLTTNESVASRGTEPTMPSPQHVEATFSTVERKRRISGVNDSAAPMLKQPRLQPSSAASPKHRTPAHASDLPDPPAAVLHRRCVPGDSSMSLPSAATRAAAPDQTRAPPPRPALADAAPAPDVDDLVFDEAWDADAWDVNTLADDDIKGFPPGDIAGANASSEVAAQSDLEAYERTSSSDDDWDAVQRHAEAQSQRHESKEEPKAAKDSQPRDQKPRSGKMQPRDKQGRPKHGNKGEVATPTRNLRKRKRESNGEGSSMQPTSAGEPPESGCKEGEPADDPEVSLLCALLSSPADDDESLGSDVSQLPASRSIADSAARDGIAKATGREGSVHVGHGTGTGRRPSGRAPSSTSQPVRAGDGRAAQSAQPDLPARDSRSFKQEDAAAPCPDSHPIKAAGTGCAHQPTASKDAAGHAASAGSADGEDGSGDDFWKDDPASAGSESSSEADNEESEDMNAPRGPRVAAVVAKRNIKADAQINRSR